MNISPILARFLVGGTIALCFSVPALSQDTAAQGEAPNAAVPTPQAVGPVDNRGETAGATGADANPKGNTGETSNQDSKTFGGISFGTGVAATFGTSDSVKSATVVNGIVRVTEVDNIRAGVMLEMHHFFTPHRGSYLFRAQNPSMATQTTRACTNKEIDEKKCEGGTPPGTKTYYVTEADPKRAMWGHGPFIGLQPGTDNIVETIGAGWMIGFRRSRESSASFNVGLGYAYRPRTQVLGDGIEENEPLPDGETQIRFKNVGTGGVFILASASF